MTIGIVDYSADENAAGNIADTRNKLNQLRLFPGQLQGQQLENQLRGLNVTNQRITNETAQSALQGAYLGRLMGVVAQATAGITDPAAIQTAGTDAIARGAAAGLYPQDFAAKALGGGAGGIDWKAIARQAVLGAGNEAERRAAIPTAGSVNQGGKITATGTRETPEGVTVDTASGTAAALPTTLTPSEKVAGITTVNPDSGQQERTSVGEQYTDTGDRRPTAAAPVVPTAPPLVTGLGPGRGAALATEGTQDAQMATNLGQRASEVPTRKAALENMRSLATDFASGPQASFWTKAGQFAQEYGLPFTSPESRDATAAQEEFNKLSIMVMAQQRATMGLPSTDASSQISAGAVPSDHLSPAGIQRVAGLMEGNEDYLAAQNQAWRTFHRAHPQEAFQDYQAQFNRLFDPRVFQAQYMTDAQRARVREQMGAAKFDAQQKALKKLGYLGGG